MNYLDTILKSIIILITLFAADYLYINVITSDFKKQMIDISTEGKLKASLVPQILTYIILTFALFYFVINSNNTREQKTLNGALLGLCMYGIYEMINGTYINTWNMQMVIPHALWGSLIFGIITFVVSSFNI